MKYNDTIHKYYENNNNIGSLDENDLMVGSSLIGAPACGDVMKLQVKIKQENSKYVIEDAKVKVFGCGSAKASSSFAAEMLIGKTIEDALKITNQDIAQALGLPGIKTHCSVLAQEAIEAAIKEFVVKNNIQLSEESKDKIFNPQDCRIGEASCKPESVKVEPKNKTPEEEQKNINNFEFNLQISKEAEDYLANFISKQKEKFLGVRIDLETSSCGLSYKVKSVKEVSDIKDDIIFKSEKVNFFIERKIAHLIHGTQMEFKKDGLKAGVFFTNPKEVGKCGCGMNFKLEDTKTDETACNK